MQKNTYKSTTKKRGLFTYLEKTLPFQSLFVDGLPVRYLPFILYMLFLGLIYVGNSHSHEKMVRQYNFLEQEVGALRVDFTALKASYMLDSKQSAVGERVASLGLYEANKPPFKVKLRP
jgi:hypothetical protein